MKSVLIANRGEIACRVIAACHKLGLETVAVCSEADAGALHVRLADRHAVIGPAPAAQSYLDAAALLRAARELGADAVHPGYGFLSENADFARKVEDAGLVWLGPDPATIALMGDKGRARAAAIAAGVPVLPGTDPIPPEAVFDASLAEGIGFPLLVKAVAGGGGIGMRRVDDPAKLAEVVRTTAAQAARTFRDGTVYLERFIAHARHIEIQLFGDGRGGVAVYPERDCTFQRRFQKVLEESPAPGLPDAVRSAMQNAARDLAAAQRYRGAGTVEFVYEAETQEWFFLEMNTRIQVEHRVTEMVTGTDLVAMQLMLGQGLLPPLTDVPAPYGWAIEARICAEAPEKGFLPRPGTLTRLDLPEAGPDLVVDCGLRAGDTVTPYYDSMIAKIVARGPNREAARESLLAALGETRIEGAGSNVAFLRLLLEGAAFREGAGHTRYIDENLADLVAAMREPA
jgi:3-methylcrotonyl-CoA carboxylase alpha subunit